MATARKGKKLNKAWLHDHLTDPYVKQAQREGFRARAAYKLKEIDEQLHLLRPGQFVVDLGAVPGAWSQYVRRKFGRGAAAGADEAGPLQGSRAAPDAATYWAELSAENGHFRRIEATLTDGERLALVAELDRRLAPYREGGILSLPRAMVLVTARR